MKETMSIEKNSTKPKASESQKTRSPKPNRKVSVELRVGENFKQFCAHVYRVATLALDNERHEDAFKESVSCETFTNYYYTLLDSRFKYLARKSGVDVRPTVNYNDPILNDPVFNMLLNRLSVATNDITNVTIDIVNSKMLIEEGFNFKVLPLTEMQRVSSELKAFNVASSWAMGYDRDVKTEGADALPMFVMFKEECDNYKNTYFVWSMNRSEPDLCYLAHVFGLNIAESQYVIANIPMVGKEEVWAQLLLII